MMNFENYFNDIENEKPKLKIRVDNKELVLEGDISDMSFSGNIIIYGDVASRFSCDGNVSIYGDVDGTIIADGTINIQGNYTGLARSEKHVTVNGKPSIL